MEADIISSPAAIAEKNAQATPQRQPEQGSAGENGNTTAQPSEVARKRRWGRATRDAMQRYFEANRDEELSISDAAKKFGISERTAAVRLSTLVGDGVLHRVSIYRLKTKD